MNFHLQFSIFHTKQDLLPTIFPMKQLLNATDIKSFLVCLWDKQKVSVYHFIPFVSFVDALSCTEKETINHSISVLTFIFHFSRLVIDVFRIVLDDSNFFAMK